MELKGIRKRLNKIKEMPTSITIDSATPVNVTEDMFRSYHLLKLVEDILASIDNNKTEAILTILEGKEDPFGHYAFKS